MRRTSSERCPWALLLHCVRLVCWAVWGLGDTETTSEAAQQGNWQAHQGRMTIVLQQGGSAGLLLQLQTVSTTEC